MAKRSLSQISFFDPEFLVPDCLRPGTLSWLLARYRSKLFPEWLLRGWRGEGRLGRKAWPARVLMTLILLRWSEEGISRVGACRRARTDLVWRAALGLQLGAPSPTEKTIREFEQFLSERHPDCGVRRIQLFHEHGVRLSLESGVVGRLAVWGIDSTPMWCYGAVLDTYRLLGNGLKRLGRVWAKATRSSLEQVSEQWELPLLVLPSVKAAFEIDWRDRAARNAALNQLAGEVLKRARFVRENVDTVRRGYRKKLLKECRNMLRVVTENLETDEKGRLAIARKVARGRLISLTDTEARHGRKSSSRTFNGFKLHQLGDAVSGLVLSLCVTPGNQHDSAVAHRLLRRANELHGEVEQVLADSAYSGAGLRHRVRRELGIGIVSPPIAQPERRGLNRTDFAIDFESGTVTCPAGVTSRSYRLVASKESAKARNYLFLKERCKVCRLKPSCPAKSRSAIRFHPYEQELRESRRAWADPSVRRQYKKRAEYERVINQTVRHGGRQARSFGLQAANIQAYAIVAQNNLRLLARKLAESSGSEKQLNGDNPPVIAV